MKYELKSNKEEKETTVLEQGELYVCRYGVGMGVIAVYSYPYGASNVDQMQLLGTDDRTTRVALDLWRKLRPDEEIERNPGGEGWRVKKVVETGPFEVGKMYKRAMGKDIGTIALCNKSPIDSIARMSEVGGSESWEASQRENWRKLQPGEVIEILEG